MMKHRLAKLETAARHHAGRPCPLCRDEPWARVYRVEDWDAGSGQRSAPEWYLSDYDTDRLTDDLRCQRCGKRVAERGLSVLYLIKGACWPLPNDPPGQTYRKIAPADLPLPG